MSSVGYFYMFFVVGYKKLYSGLNYIGKFIWYRFCLSLIWLSSLSWASFLKKIITGLEFMKLLQPLVLLGSLCAVSGAQAGAVGNLTLIVDWNSLSISSTEGVTMTPTTITDPVGKKTFSTSTDGFLGYGNPFSGIDFFTPTEDSISRTYSDAERNLSAGYDGTQSAAHSDINKLPGSDALWGGADVFHEIAYKADSSGLVTFEISYSLTGSVSIEGIDPFEYVNGHFSTTIEALDYDVFTDAYNQGIDAGLDSETAEDQAEALGLVFLDNDEKVLELFDDCDFIECISSVSRNEILSLTFAVEADKEYLFGVGGGVSTYSDVSAVPVPAAVWLFGTGLLGLVGVSRRRN